MKPEINKLLTILRRLVSFDITDSELISFSLDISRNADSKITRAINEFKTKNNLKITSREKNEIRDYILGKTSWILEGIPKINKDKIISDNDVITSLNILLTGIDRNPKKVFGTLEARVVKKRNGLGHNIKKYESIIKKIESDKNQLLILQIRPGSDPNGLLESIKSAIAEEYNNLSNYHNMAIIFEDHKTSKLSWSLISKVAVFCEYLKVEKNFQAFNRQRHNKIEELMNFLISNKNISFDKEIEKAVYSFYNGLSYGFQFVDLLLSKDGKVKILLMQKIELDETPYPCPECMETHVRGNSYPKLLQKSFECQNHACPSRSKIGRGKRFDFLSVKKNLALELKNEKNIIPSDIAKSFRRDIFDSSDNYLEMLIRFYSYNESSVRIISNFTIDKKFGEYLGRNITHEFLNKYKVETSRKDPFTTLMNVIVGNFERFPEKPSKQKTTNTYSLYNGNSSNILEQIPERVSGAITSPPYYNAREYSQWPTFICYLIDMGINASAVLNKLNDKSYYFYNIGDIVGQDNVFISSHMSKRRLMLGFYSSVIFEIVGFSFVDNIIWDKGEVQSKRNSTQNLFPGYINPINCYEHILIFGKNIDSINVKANILILDSVKKINSKGENILGHTAPFPEGLVQTIFPHIDRGGYLLDPFLGSGTTIIASNKNNIKSVGIELNNSYYDLALERISNS